MNAFSVTSVLSRIVYISIFISIMYLYSQEDMSGPHIPNSYVCSSELKDFIVFDRDDAVNSKMSAGLVLF